MGKGTWQVRPSAKASFLLNKNINDRFHRRNAPYLIVEDKATGLQEQPAQNYLVQWNQVVGSRGILDARVGRMWGIFPFRFQKDVRPTDIAIRDQVRLTRINCRRDAVGQSQRSLPGGDQRQLLPPERTDGHARLQGRRAVLVGARAVPAHQERRLLPRAARRCAVSGAAVEHADQLGSSPATRGASSCRIAGWSGARRSTPACAWMASSAYLPRADQSRRCTFVGERSFPKADVFSISVQHRAAPGHLVRPARQRPDGGQGVLRPLLQSVRFADCRSGQPERDCRPGGELERSQRQPRARSRRARHVHRLPARACSRPSTPTRRVPTARSSTSASSSSSAATWRCRRATTGGITATVSASSIARAGRRRTRRSRAPTSIRSAGQTQSITIYSLRPEFITARDRYISNVEVLRSDYNGVQFDFQKRMSNRWQMLAGPEPAGAHAASTTAAPTPASTSATRTRTSTATTDRCSSICRGRSRCRAATMLP